MRYFLAILSLVIAVVLLVLGIGQRTFLGGPTSVQRTLEPATSSEEFSVIPASVFEELPGKASVTLAGENLFLAIGHNRDVSGWLDPVGHSLLSLEDGGSELTAEQIPAGQSPEPETRDGDDVEDNEAADDSQEPDSEPAPNPRGSDLWLSEYTGENTLKVSLALEPDQSVLLASGTDGAPPSSITVSWAKERDTPLAGPLLVTGGLFAALGAILYLFALDHDRRGLGPRRRRTGPFQGLRNTVKGSGRTRIKMNAETNRSSRKRAIFATTFIASGALVMTGCSPSYWPQASEPTPTEETINEVVEDNDAPVPVTDAQVGQIVSRVAEVVTEADRNLDSELLAERLTGPAFAQREANYKIRAQEPSYQVPPILTDNRLGYELIQSTEKWPRTMFITVESAHPDSQPDETESEAEAPEASEGAEAQPNEELDLEPTPSLALIMTQETPQDNYLVSQIISLRGGIEMPTAAPITEGTAVLSDDIKTLRLEPSEVATALASVLQDGAESEAAEKFDLEDEVLVERMGVAWAAEQSGENVTYSAEITKNDVPTITFSTGQGGALVVASILDDHITTASGDRYRVELSKIEQALGLEGSQKRVVQHWQHNVLFYVPSAESGNRIQILGSTSEIVGASN